MPAPIVILGFNDPEAKEIERLTRNLNLSGYYLMHGNTRVSRNDAYRGNRFQQFSGVRTQFENRINNVRNELLFIESKHPSVETRLRRLSKDGIPRATITHIDHHHPGDPGYDVDEFYYLLGSSIGQFIDKIVGEWNYRIEEFSWTKRLDRGVCMPGVQYVDHPDYNWIVVRYADDGELEQAVIPKRILITAVADHCLPAGYKGQCPGVDPQELREYRSAIRAKMNRTTPEKIEKTIEFTQRKLRSMAVGGIADLTNLPGGTLPEAPEAASREGVAVLCRVKDARTRRRKILLFGDANPSLIERWMEEHRECAYEVYGSPTRGYAGAILDPPEGSVDLHETTQRKADEAFDDASQSMAIRKFQHRKFSKSGFLRANRRKRVMKLPDHNNSGRECNGKKRH